MRTPEETRLRILDGALTCVERWGLTKTSLEDVASASGLSRATVYRYFPGGRDQVITETVAWEVGRFLQRLVDAVGDAPGIEATLTRALVIGHRAIDEHKLLQHILSTERAEFLTELVETDPDMLVMIRRYLVEQLTPEQRRAGVDIDEAADYLARLFLSYLGSQGRWDLSDPDQARRLVRTQFLAGIIAPAPTDVP